MAWCWLWLTAPAFRVSSDTISLLAPKLTSRESTNTRRAPHGGMVRVFSRESYDVSLVSSPTVELFPCDGESVGGTSSTNTLPCSGHVEGDFWSHDRNTSPRMTNGGSMPHTDTTVSGWRPRIGSYPRIFNAGGSASIHVHAFHTRAMHTINHLFAHLRVTLPHAGPSSSTG